MKDFHTLKYETKAEADCGFIFIKSLSSGFLNAIQKWLLDLYSVQFTALTCQSTAVPETLLSFSSTVGLPNSCILDFVPIDYVIVNLSFVEV